MNYGQPLKRLLTDEFRIHLVLGFDGRVFPDALVKPVVLLAEKTRWEGPVSFARLRDDVSLASLETLLADTAAGCSSPWASVTQVLGSELSPQEPWTAFLKMPDVYSELCQSARLTPLKHTASTRLGLQTFAKSFYVIPRQEVQSLGIELEYILSLVFSPKDMKSPVIEREDQLPYVVFACDRPDGALTSTGAGRYIAHAMQAVVEVRGKGSTVQGFRLVRSGRQPWYNIRTEIERRGSSPILLPRRVFQSYMPIHNRLGVVASENFIEVCPHAGARDISPLLAFLSSCFGEFVLRSRSFQYGGGVYNLSPGAVPEIPALNCALLPSAGRRLLSQAWETFVKSYSAPGARTELDRAVKNVLNISADLQGRTQDALKTLIELATAANRSYRGFEPRRVDDA